MCLRFLGEFLIYEAEGVCEVIGMLRMMHHDASHHDVMHHDVENFGRHFL